MKLKIEVVILFLGIQIMNVFGQVSSANEFLDFSLMDSHDKIVYLEDGWVRIGADKSTDSGMQKDNINYWRFYQKEKYFLTLSEVKDLNMNNSFFVTKVSFVNEAIFNNWKKELETIGISFIKNKSGEEKWVTIDESPFVIYAEKRKMKDIWIYEFSIII